MVPRYWRRIDLTGQTFGLLTAISRLEEPANDGRGRWLCRCTCGNETVVQTNNLKQGHTRSCGCLGGRFKRTHGYTANPETRALFSLWTNMHKRCSRPSDRSYPRWGGRGITVCAEWSDFAQFLADMGPRPSTEHSIDRIDNDGPYSPENCRWATRKEQARNKRDCHYITLQGETKTLSEWSEITGIKRTTIGERLLRGWSVEDALTKQVNPWRKPYKRAA